MQVTAHRVLLTFRLTEEGGVLPTTAVFFDVDGLGPFMVEGGPPPLQVGPTVRKIREEAERIRSTMEALKEV